MKKYYYKNIPAKTIKSRLSKLIDLNKKNWELYETFNRVLGDTPTEKSLKKRYLSMACSTQEAVDALGISQYKYIN